MRISELSAAADVPVATIKFYLREGLLPAGEAVARTRSEYGEIHLERLRLIRALTGVGGLGIAAVRRVLRAIDEPGTDRLDVLATAQDALPPVVDRAASAPRAREWVTARGWMLDDDSPLLDELETAWAACGAAGIGVDAARLSSYADAVESIAEVDVRAVPADAVPAVRQVVLGTVLVDPLLAVLRRMAQQDRSVRQATRD
ncbi:MerR family transcriptional regulator [Brachybacterium huguangmaarense]